MRWIALALLLSGPSAAAEDKGAFDPSRWLERPGVRLLAVSFHARGCKPCGEASGKWQELLRKHRGDGLRVVVISAKEPGGSGCVDPGWKPDEVICDRLGALAKRFGVKHPEARGLLWSWTGELLVEKGGVAEVAWQIPPVLQAPRPRVLVDSHRVDAGIDLSRERLSALVFTAINRDRRLDADLGTFSPPREDLGPCADRKGLEGLVLAASLLSSDSRRELELVLLGEARSCVLARARAPWQDRDPSGSAESALRGLLSAIRGPPKLPRFPAVSAPKAEEEGGGSARERLIVSSEETPQDRLRKVAEAWLGTRYEIGGKDRHGMDAPAFARVLFRDALGLSLPKTLLEQYRNGEAIHTGEAGAKEALRPGDLIFYVTHADVPRHVAVYLGGGEMAHATEIRGVVIDELPTEMPVFFWLRGVRPNALR